MAAYIVEKLLLYYVSMHSMADNAERTNVRKQARYKDLHVKIRIRFTIRWALEMGARSSAIVKIADGHYFF
jgi:predicted DNA-binding protein YlxM (UPF0122 family)